MSYTTKKAKDSQFSKYTYFEPII